MWCLVSRVLVSATISSLIFKSFIHFKLIFVGGIRYGYSLILGHVNVQVYQHLLKNCADFFSDNLCSVWKVEKVQESILKKGKKRPYNPIAQKAHTIDLVEMVPCMQFSIQFMEYGILLFKI